MTLLQVWAEARPDTTVLRTRDADAIADALAGHDIAFRRWELRTGTGTGADAPASATPASAAVTAMSSEDLLAAYREEIDGLCAAQGLRLVDVARLHPEDTDAWRERAAAARETFLAEHRHGEDEVRFFAHGSGCFYLRLEGRVHAMVCEAGDLLSVPAGTRHWFDMGSRPDFAAIRFFQKEDGWVGDFTGDPIASHFANLDELLADGR
jgi:1,2-dihydroxy-3-keto-5-methylthiopentene dioxygenase